MATYPQLRPERASIEIPEEFLRPVVPNEVRETLGIEEGPPAMPLHRGRYAIDPHDERAAKRHRELVRLGIMSERAFVMARKPVKYGSNPVRIVGRNADRMFRLDYAHNLRTFKGNTWMFNVLSGSGYGSATGFGLHAAFTASSASPSGTPTVTSTITPTANQFVGHILSMGNSYGYIVSHTAVANAVFTLDRWYDTSVNTMAAIATYPSAGPAVIVPGNSPGQWVALTNDSGAVLNTDTVLAAEISGNQLARTFGRAQLAYTEASTGTGTVQGSYTATVTFAANATQSFQKSGIFNAVNNGTMIWEATLTSTTLFNSDQAIVTWTVQF